MERTGQGCGPIPKDEQVSEARVPMPNWKEWKPEDTLALPCPDIENQGASGSVHVALRKDEVGRLDPSTKKTRPAV